MIILNLIQNVALLVALAATYQVIGSTFEKNSVGHQILSGILFGGVGLVGMMTPLNFMPGIIIDGRSIILGVSGLFGGPLVASIAATMCGAYRLWLGGAGAWVGVGVIMESAALGVILYFLRKGAHAQLTLFSLYVFGLLVHVIMLGLMMALPGGAGLEVIRQLALPILTVYPFATMLICRLFLDYEHQIENRKALRESERKYRDLVQNANSAIIRWKADGTITYLNEYAQSLFGYSQDEAVGEHVGILIPKRESTGRDLTTMVEDIATHPELYVNSVNENVCRDGRRIWMAWTHKAIVDKAQRVTEILAVGSDITALKQAEQDLKNAENRYRSVFANAAIGVDLVDAEGRLLEVNASLAQMLGYSVDELTDLTIFDITHPEDLDDSRSRYQKMVQGRADSYRFEKRYVRKDGTTVWADVSISPVRGPDGKHVATIGVIADITDRKKSEEELRISHHRLDQIIQFLPDATMVIDSDGRLIAWNKAMEELTGVPGFTMLGKGDYEYALPFYGTRRPVMLDLVLNFDEEVASRYLFVKREGNQIVSETYLPDFRGQGPTWFWNVAAPLYDADGHVVGAIESVRNITELKKSEEALRASEERFRILANGAFEGIVISKEGVILDCNNEFCNMTGYSLDEIVGMNVVDLVVPEYKDIALQHMLSGSEDEYESAILRKDGRRVPVKVKGKSFPYEGGTARIASVRDMSEARKAQEAQKRLATAIEQAAEGILITDKDGVIQYVNPAVERITGFSREELVGNTPRIFQSGEHDPTFYRNLWDTIKSGKTWSGRFTNRKKDGRIYYEDATVSPVKGTSGKIMNFVAVKRDITETLELSKQLYQAQKMEAVGTLAGGIAHDFNNILQVVLGYSELVLSDEQLPSRFREDLARINQASRNGADLVQRLLTFSRKTEIKPLHINLNRRIEQLRKMLSRTISKLIHIELILADDLAAINADPTQVDQVLVNLAVNARDAMPTGGRLIIETKNVTLDEDYSRAHLGATPGRYVLLTVSDTGHGMDRETLQHIFEPFFTTKDQGEGTGLGLATVYGIVKQHRGYIMCYSEPGAGTTFKIYFPAIVADKELTGTAVKIIPRKGSGTILLVDDEEHVRDLGVRILTKAGYKVVTASNGKEAVNVYARRGDEIALVILDLMMPEMGGKKCLLALRELNPQVKVIIASGYSANGATKETLSSGAKGFVNKPYDIRQLLDVVGKVLAGERAI